MNDDVAVPPAGSAPACWGHSRGTAGAHGFTAAAQAPSGHPLVPPLGLITITPVVMPIVTVTETKPQCIYR